MKTSLKKRTVMMSAEDRLRPEVDVDEEEDSGEVVTMFQKKKRLLRWRLTGSSILPVAVLLCLAFGYAQAVAECMSGNNLKCFECNSHEDIRCNDPFNWTTLPPIKVCEGCCVKMIQGIGTPSYSVTRTCTSELRINLFMVDHVCMSQSNRKGSLCFCEEDLCNGTGGRHQGAAPALLAGLFLFILHRRMMSFSLAPS